MLQAELPRHLWSLHLKVAQIAFLRDPRLYVCRRKFYDVTGVQPLDNPSEPDQVPSTDGDAGARRKCWLITNGLRSYREEWSALDSYKQGVGTVTAAVEAETHLFEADLAEADAYISARSAAVTLAFATGNRHNSVLL